MYSADLRLDHKLGDLS